MRYISLCYREGYYAPGFTNSQNLISFHISVVDHRPYMCNVTNDLIYVLKFGAGVTHQWLKFSSGDAIPGAAVSGE